VAVAVVIVVIPITFRVPATLVFIPPSMVAVPAALPRFAQFMARVCSLPAPIAKPCNGLIESVICARDAALAIMFVGTQERHCSEHQKAGQHCRRQDRFPDQGIVQTMLHRYGTLLDSFQ
jgi:hypothetical protein